MKKLFVPIWITIIIIASAIGINGTYIPAGNINGTPKCIVTTDSPTATTDTTVSDDTQLLFPIETAGTYKFEALALFSTGTSNTPDVKITYTVPTSATFSYSVDGYASGATTVASGHHTLSEAATGTGLAIGVITTTQTPTSPVWMDGIVISGGTAGNVVFQWSQLVSDAQALTRNPKSYICFSRLQ